MYSDRATGEGNITRGYHGTEKKDGMGVVLPELMNIGVQVQKLQGVLKTCLEQSVEDPFGLRRT